MNDLAALVPATVVVAFPAIGVAAPASGFLEISVTLSSLQLVQFNNITGSPWRKLLHRYDVATYGSSGPATNLTALTALATRVAQDWYTWQLAPLDKYLAGAVNWDPEGFHNLEWMQGRGRITTHVQRGKINPADDLLYAAITNDSGGSGIITINGDSTPDQLLTVGTAGNDFNIDDTTPGTHVFNLPDASTSARGVITVNNQDLSGGKTIIANDATSVAVGGWFTESSLSSIIDATQWNVSLSGSTSSFLGFGLQSSWFDASAALMSLGFPFYPHNTAVGNLQPGNLVISSTSAETGIAAFIYDVAVFMTTVTDFVLPAVGATVSVTVTGTGTAGFSTNQKLRLQEVDSGTAQVLHDVFGHITAIADSTHFTFMTDMIYLPLVGGAGDTIHGTNTVKFTRYVSRIGVSTIFSDTTEFYGGWLVNVGSAFSALAGTNTGDQLIFQTFAVSGQSNVVADTTADTVTFVNGTNIAITTNAGTDSITFSLTGQVALANGGTGSNLSDPGANKLWGWDDTDNSIGFWTIGSGLSYDHSTHTISATGGGATDGVNASIPSGSQVDALNKKISPSLGSSPVDNYNPTSFSVTAPTTSVIRITNTLGADITIRGLLAGADGQIVLLTNEDATFDLILKSNDTNSTAANRFDFFGNYDVKITPHSSAMLQYRTSDSRWHMLGTQFRHPLVSNEFSNDVNGVISPNKADLLVGNNTPVWDRLAVGTDGFILTADSAQTKGVKWASPTAVGSAGVSIGVATISAGTLTQQTVTGNVASISRTSAGVYKITFSSSYGSANSYALIAISDSSPSTFFTVTTRNTGDATITSGTPGVDAAWFCVMLSG